MLLMPWEKCTHIFHVQTVVFFEYTLRPLQYMYSIYCNSQDNSHTLSIVDFFLGSEFNR